MSNIFLIADLHLGQESAMKWLDNDGKQIRKFANASEMDEHIVKCHNGVIGVNDKVYMLGDIAVHKKYLPTLLRMNGKKVLIKGNHDQEKMSEYAKYFYDIRGSHQLEKFILTHIPIHPESLSRWHGNIHGHLHHRSVMLGDKIDPRYICVSAEQVGYFPIPLEDVQHIMKQRNT
jgi:calcineurin-like phosphoesterase family protein